MALFRAETLARIRRRIGYLTQGSDFVYGAITATSPNTFTLPQAARMPDDHFVGRVAHFLDTGESLSIQASENGTGMMTVVPAFAVEPDVGTTVEIWAEGIAISEVNEAINTAIIEVSDQAAVKTRATIAEVDFSADRMSFDLPDNWSHISGVFWHYSLTPERATYVSDRGRMNNVTTWPPEYTVEGHTVHLNWALPSSVTEVEVIGYRLPNELEDDDDESEVRSDYLVYKAASLLQMEDIGTVSNDPDSHNTRSTGWLSHAEMVRAKMKVRWDSNTVALE